MTAVLDRPKVGTKSTTRAGSTGNIVLPPPAVKIKPVNLIVTKFDGVTPIDKFSGERRDFVGMTVAQAVASAKTMTGFPPLKSEGFVNTEPVNIQSERPLEAGDTLTLVDP